MKLILLGFFRRWWGWYLGALVLAIALDVAQGVLPLPWIPYLFAPWLSGLLLMLDLISGAAALTLSLPVSTKSAARAYWIASVCAPPVLLVFAQITAAGAAAILGVPTAPERKLPWEFGETWLVDGLSLSLSWQGVVFNFVISLVLSGFSVFAATFLPINSLKQSGDSLSIRVWNIIAALGVMSLFNAGLFSGCGMPMILDSVERNTAAIFALLALAVFCLVLGYARSEAMLLRWARMRPQQGSHARTEARFMPGSAWISSGLPSLFFDTFWATLMMAGSVLIGGIFFKVLRANWVFIHYTLFFCSVLAALRFVQSLRPLRVLPISTSQLAWTLLLLPITNAFLYILLLGVAGSLGLTGAALSELPLSSVVLTTGLASLSGGLCIRFGVKALVLMTMFGIWFLMAFGFLATRFHWPTALYWIVGLSLMAGTLGLLRRWLNASGTYRFRGEPAAIS